MTKRELLKIINPNKAQQASVERSYTRSEDHCKVTLEFSSDTPMTAMDLIEAVCDFLNDTIANVVKEQTKS